MAHSRPSGAASARGHWWHLALLAILLTLVEISRVVLGSERPFALSLVFQRLYWWLPAISGIAMSVDQPDKDTTRRGVWVGLVCCMATVCLDLGGNHLPAGARESLGLFPDASLAQMTAVSQALVLSWVELAIEWVRSGVPGFDQITSTYGADDPRLRVAEAFVKSGAILLVFASIAFVISATSWIKARVVFSTDVDRRASQVVVAWLMTPLLTAAARDLAAAQRFRVLFSGAPVWRPLVPYVLFLLLSIAALRYTARYRSSEES